MTNNSSENPPSPDDDQDSPESGSSPVHSPPLNPYAPPITASEPPPVGSLHPERLHSGNIHGGWPTIFGIWIVKCVLIVVGVTIAATTQDDGTFFFSGFTLIGILTPLAIAGLQHRGRGTIVYAWLVGMLLYGSSLLLYIPACFAVVGGVLAIESIGSDANWMFFTWMFLIFGIVNFFSILIIHGCTKHLWLD
ncbi:MAG: hypothetical protein AAFP90_18745 [Planctomycetota bacterium]